MDKIYLLFSILKNQYYTGEWWHGERYVWSVDVSSAKEFSSEKEIEDMLTDAFSESPNEQGIKDVFDEMSYLEVKTVYIRS